MHALWARYVSGPSVFLVLAVGVLALFAAVPKLGDGFFRPVENFFSRFSSRKMMAAAAFFFAALGARLALLPALGVPLPANFDERGYLLIAEMFTSGHLAYPPHPLWKSFETFNVNFSPTYSSMYPPAQGALLALGDLLGHPWIGVLLSVALMSAAIVWMLQAWLPARWAFLGGVLAFCNLAIVSYWVNSYWGGALAAIGGAMVLGALPRIVRSHRIRDSLGLGIGLAILANSRPFEGMLLSLPAAAWLLVRLAKHSPPWRTTLLKIVLPITVVLCLTAAFMGYYNRRLTGDALLMPHSLNFRLYYRVPLFLWQPLRPPMHYNNQQYEDFYNGWLRSRYDRSWRAAGVLTYQKLRTAVEFFLWPGALPTVYCLPLVFPPLVWTLLVFRDRRVRLLLIEFLFCFAGMFCVVYFWPHYAAPLTGVIFALLVQGFRHLRVMRYRGRPFGLGLARASMVLLLLATALNVVARIRTPDRQYSESWNRARRLAGNVNIEEQLDRIPGDHLVMVRYGPQHNPRNDWVFNHADIDASRIVWARDLDPQQNAKLFAYFKNRHVWLFEPDRDPDKVVPYSPPR